MKTIMTGLLLIGSMTSFASIPSMIESACLENEIRMLTKLAEIKNATGRACDKNYVDPMGYGYDEESCLEMNAMVKKSVADGNMLSIFLSDRNEAESDLVSFSCDTNEVRMETTTYSEISDEFEVQEYSAKLDFDKDSDILKISSNDIQYTIQLAVKRYNGTKIIGFGKDHFSGLRSGTVKIDGVEEEMSSNSARLSFQDILFPAIVELNNDNVHDIFMNQMISYSELLSELSI